MAKKREEHVLGGFYGFYGNCEAAVGTGIFTSLITNATPLSRLGWRRDNLSIAQSLLSIAEQGGPRRCKRNTFLAILQTENFVNKNFRISFKINKKLKCNFYSLKKSTLNILFFSSIKHVVFIFPLC
jgi:hypothetical protein